MRNVIASRKVLLLALVVQYANTLKLVILNNAENSTRNNHTNETVTAMAEILWVYVDVGELYYLVRKTHELKSKNIDLFFVNSTNEYILKLVTKLQKAPSIHINNVKKPQFTKVIEKKNIENCNNIVSKNGEPDVTSERKYETEYDVSCQRLSMIGDHLENSYVANMAASVIKHLKWSYVLSFYDSTTAPIMDLLSLQIAKEGTSVKTYNIDDLHDSNIDYIMDEIYNTTALDIINATIMCREECVRQILTKVNAYDSKKGNIRRTSMRDHSAWFIVTRSMLPNNNFISKELSLDNVFILNMALPVPERSVTAQTTLVTSMEHLLSTLTNLSDSGGNSSSNEVYNIKDKIDRVFGVNTCVRYYLSTLMWVSHNHHTKLTRQFDCVGHVDINGGLELCKGCKLMPNEQFGLNQRTLLITTRWWPPFTERIQKNGTTVGYMGFCVDLLNELKNELNFTYIWTEPPDGEWGTLLDNGTWTGMIGQLERREVDLMVAAVSIQADREMDMDFTHPFYYDVSTILMRRPHPDESKILTLMKPFKWQVLLALACVLPFSAITLCLIERASPYYRVYGVDGRQNFQMSFWYMFGAILCQGGESLPNSNSGRTMISFFWLFSILFVGTYCGNLIAFLTVSIEKPPFQSMAELVQQDDYTWGTLGGTYFITWFGKSELSVLQDVWKGIVEFNKTMPWILHPDPNVHIDKILNEKYVYMGDKVYMDFRTSNDCRLMTAEEEYPNMQYGVGLPNNSLHTRMFSNKILELHESGIFEIFKQKHWPMKQICPGTLNNHVEEIVLVDVQSAFYLLGLGIFVGGSSLLLEFFIMWRRKRRKKSKNSPCEHLRTTSTIDLEEYANASSNGNCLQGKSSIEIYQNGNGPPLKNSIEIYQNGESKHKNNGYQDDVS